MIKIQNGQLVIVPSSFQEKTLKEQMECLTEWRNAILALLGNNMNGTFDGGTMIWIAEMLEDISPDAEQLGEWLHKYSKTN
jgi:hypothetical protein